MKSLRFVSFLVIAAVWFAVAPSAQAADGAEGKFHLVYLVSAVDLKPGARVTVDPVFFTDGTQIRNFHDLCRRKDKAFLAGQPAADRKFTEEYCANKTFTIGFKGFHILNNHGQSISLGDIGFQPIGEAVVPPDVEHQSDAEIKMAVMMGHSQVHSYAPGTVEPPKWLRNDGAPEYFFLMSREKSLLKQIVPVSRATKEEIDALTKRAVEFSRVAKWRMAGRPLQMKNINKARLCYDVSVPVLFQMANPLIADLDVDGKLDLFVGVRTTVKLEQDPEKPIVDCFTSYRILGNGDALLVGSEQIPQTRWSKVHSEGGALDAYLRNGYAARTTQLLLRLSEAGEVCNYALGYSASVFSTHPEGYMLSSANCQRSISLPKLIHPSGGKPYQTKNEHKLLPSEDELAALAFCGVERNCVRRKVQ